MIDSVIHYSRVGLVKRTFIALVDIFITLFLSFIISLASLSIFQTTSLYKNVTDVTTGLRIKSGLFIDGYTDVIESLESKEDITIEKMNFKIDETIINFYSNDYFFSDDYKVDSYNKRKLESSILDKKLFVETIIDGKVVVLPNTEAKISDSEYLSFYKYEFYKYAVNELYAIKDYHDANMVFVTANVTIILISAFISTSLLYILVPLIFRRDSATLGMKIFKCGLINKDGYSLSNKEFAFRYLFLFIVEIVLGIASFYITTLISYTCMLFNKKESPLHDSLIDVMMVEKNHNKIYKTVDEYNIDINKMKGL